MYFLIVHLQTQDFAKWKAVFDERTALRSSHGCLAERVFRSERDPNEVSLMLEWDNLDRARRFVESLQTQEAREHAGVIGVPRHYFVHEVSRLPL
jgi:heme-degrading monooxygenase HmoA